MTSRHSSLTSTIVEVEDHPPIQWNGGSTASSSTGNVTGSRIRSAFDKCHRMIGHCTIVGCGIFIYVYFLFGKVTFLSQHWYQPLISKLASWMIPNERYQTDKAVVPLFMIVIPTLLAGMSAILLRHHSRRRLIVPPPRIQNGTSIRVGPPFSSSRSYHFDWIHPLQQWIRSCCICGVNHTNTIILVAIYLPLLVYTCMSLIQKHLFSDTSWQMSNQNDTLSEIGNTFGIVALFGMSFVLIPVTKYSAILQYFSYTQNLGTQQRIHQTLGSFVIFSVLCHVAMHCYRWYAVQNYNNVLSMIFLIPSTCWNKSSWSTDDESIALVLCPPSPHDNSTVINTGTTITSDCTCYGRVRNVMGAVAAMALLIVACTTVVIPTFRRYYYRTFYILHRILGPIIFLFVILHWNRSIIYLSGSILCYLAGTVPIWVVQSMMKRPTQSPRPTSTTTGNNLHLNGEIDGHIHITSIERIAACRGNDENPLMALTFETTKEVFDELHCHPGQYVKLHVPSISLVSHPFTINQVLTDTNSKRDASPSPQMYQLRVLFRSVGPFTKNLARTLLLLHNHDRSSPASTTSRLTHIYVDGFYGPVDRLMHILSNHDHVIFVAGGIGITPFLSLLHNIVHELFCNETSNHDRFALKKVTLYWTCRDSELIEYVQREYFGPIVKLFHDGSNATCAQHPKVLDLHINIHQTNEQDGNIIQYASGRENLMRMPPRNISYTNLEQQSIEETNDFPTNDATTRPTTTSAVSGDGNGMPFVPTSHFFPGPRITFLSNFVSCLVYCGIVWIGLPILWYIYTRHQTSDTVLPRILGPLAIVVHSYIVSRGMYWLSTQFGISRYRQWFRAGYHNCNRKDSNHECVDVVTETNSHITVKSSDWMPIHTSDDNIATNAEGLKKSSSIEMGLVDDDGAEQAHCCGSLETSRHKSNEHDVNVDKEKAVMERFSGRLSAHQIVRQFDIECDRPGLFVCGPSSLMSDIRNAMNQRCSLTCHRNRSSHIALYEETFEI